MELVSSAHVELRSRCTMDIIDVEDVLVDDSFIGDTERLDDEVEEILKQWKSSSTFPSSSSDGATTSSSVGSSNSGVPTAGPPPAAAAAAASNSFGFGTGTNHHHHQHLYSNSSNSSGNGYGNGNNSFNSDSKGLKYIDTRTFTRPKKKLDSTFNASNNVSAELVPGTHEHTIKMSSPLLNLQIGGPVTLSPTPTPANNSSLGSSQLMQKSWLNDVSPPGSIMSSMEFSVNEKLGSSLITSGDFTNVSYLLNGGGPNGVAGEESTLNSHSSYDGYRLADVIKDRKFLENLSSCFDENTMTKDCAISRTDLNGIEEAALSGSGFSTMQSSLESVTAKASGDGTMVLESGKADVTFELEPTAAAPTAIVRERLNGTFERRRNFDTYRKPKSSLNSTFDALPKVDAVETMPVANKTFDAGADEDNILDATFGVTASAAADNCNGTFSLNRTARVNGADKQLNQTYEYCEKSPAVADRTFEARRNGTFVEDVGSPANRTPNGTFELPVVDRLGESVDMVQSTPFVQVPRMKRVSGISEYEVNCSPIAAAPLRRSEAMRRSRNLEQDMSTSHLETDDFDVEFRKLPITPNAKTEGSHLLDNHEKRISLQHFEEFEKSIMESENNGLDFDEMLNSLTSDVRRSTDSSVKLRQSLDNIKKRHSRINTEKQQQQEELRKRGSELNDTAPTMASPLDNKLADSMIRSMSSSSGSERLLNRRSRYNDDVHLTLSPQQQMQKSVTEQQQQQQQEVETSESNRTAESNANPAPTASEVGGSDKKNRDRFKTIRISKRREEGMVVVDPDDGFAVTESAALPMEEELPGSPQVAPTAISSAFGRVDYNSPKESRMVAAGMEQNKTEDATVFKRPQLVGGIPKAESKTRSLSKPRSYYGVTPSAGGFGLRPKDLALPFSAKSSSTDNLENDRPNYQQPPPPGRLSLGGKLGGSGGVGLTSRGPAVQSNLKSPMGTKSKSHHNLYFNQSSSLGGSNSSLHRIPAGPLGLSAQKLSHNNSNTELSGVQMRAPKAAAASRLGLVRPSSGYFSYSSSSHKKIVDSDTESINSLSSSSASSRGSLYRVDSQTIANNVQTGGNGAAPSVEDISLGLKASLMESNRMTATGLKAPSAATAPKPSGLRPPSNLRPPTARSGLPRPTSYVRR